MTDHQKPTGNMSAAQLVALYADEGRHPFALEHELRFCPMASLLTLAYGEYAEAPMANVHPKLAEFAYDEMERRENAKRALLADNPLLRALVAS